MNPLPAQHAQRLSLHNEVHARPPEPMGLPMALSHVVMVCNAQQRDASRAHMAALARDHHLPAPDVGSIHLRMDFGLYRVRWELHTEFVTWTFMRPIAGQGGAERELELALDAVPQQWFAALPGECLASLHLWVQPTQDVDTAPWIRQVLHEETLVASTVADGFGEVYTDFAVHADGFSRMVLLAGGMTSRRLGRLVQSLLEIETYRMAALLGLPAAREASAVLASAERELAALAEAIRTATRDDEPQLLDRLTRLAGQVESQHAATHSRFSASAAYFELVDKRIEDIAESRLAGMQTIGEFMERRLTPARSTCAWSSRRQDALSQRVSRISNLLRTRVEIEQQQSSQALLATMNSRQGMQLKLQSTVEGLSVAAITYYIVGLASYLAKGAQHWGWPWSPEMTAAAAIPVVAVSVWWSLRRLHHRVFRSS
ncbi:DUF3422 domain-containing protein [Rhodoferax sp.]|uniref:DUF3422 family protein n=1 Tax=Rhodoferax sp. TaxID=50421 RepID=UPI002ACE0399|nr:DUF3422 domain-containing protein [Rhodoferax sp.]MDZ7919722.1 DUF3422 domain-containing protein [Rhodoferax sp.]